MQCATLTGERLTYNHESVTHSNHLIDLDNLLSEVVMRLQITLFELVIECGIDIDIVGFGQDSAGEQVWRDVTVEG